MSRLVEPIKPPVRKLTTKTVKNNPEHISKGRGRVMQRFYKEICGALCGLILLCVFGVRAYAMVDCMAEILPNNTKAYVAVPKDLEFKLTLERGKDLGVIPKEFIDEKGALKRDFSYALASDSVNLKAKYDLNKSLVVQAENGQKYRLPKDIKFELVDPAPNYTAKILAGTKLTKQEGTTPEKYALAEEQKVNITPPENYQVSLKIISQPRVERIPEPGASSMGTTLEVRPKRAPIGGCITLFVEKSGFDINKALFHVCLRLQGKDEPKSFIPSQDVELKGVKGEKAELSVRIPEISELGGVHFAKPVELLVVARIPEDKQTETTKVKMIEVITQDFSVSSRPLAVICWILAFVLPWFIAALVALDEKARTQANQTRWQAWKAQLNPIWIVSGKDGGASLSLAQILLWTMLVFTASFYVLVVSGKLLDLTDAVLVLLGIAGGTSVIAKIAASGKQEKGQELAGAELKRPNWLELIQTEGRPDLYKFQMALFTVLAAVFVTGKIFETLMFPELPAGLLTLIGISNGVYLAAKATSSTVFEKLSDKVEELKKAEDELKKAREEAGKCNEAAGKATDEKKEEANKAMLEADNCVKDLTTKVENLKTDIKNLKEKASKQS
jgi:hypothetical protein